MPVRCKRCGKSMDFFIPYEPLCEDCEQALYDEEHPEEPQENYLHKRGNIL